MQANHEKLLRRSGRLPVADGLRTYNLAQLLHVEPHHYLLTANLTHRRDRALLIRSVDGGPPHATRQRQQAATTALH